MTDVSSLMPPDAVVALRSFPRRYTAAVDSAGHDERGEVTRRIGPDGVSVLDLLVDTTRTLEVAGHAISQILPGEVPMLPASVLDPTDRDWSDYDITDAESELALLGAEATELADTIERVPGADWELTAHVAGGGSCTALDVVREAVRTAADNLRAANRAIKGP